MTPKDASAPQDAANPEDVDSTADAAETESAADSADPADTEDAGSRAAHGQVEGVLPKTAAEDDPRAWGDRDDDHDAWLKEQKPPHWG